MGLIYKITNNVDGKIYIGQTRVSEPVRWQQHVWHANNDPKGDCILLCNAIKKYGKDNFSRVILEKCDNNILNDREKYWIRYYNSSNRDIGYNVEIGGEGHSKFTDEEILTAYKNYGSIIKGSQSIGMSREQFSIRLQALGVETQREVAICQYDLQGNFIKEYSTLKEAAEVANVNTVTLSTEGIYNDYIWLRKNSSLSPLDLLQQSSYCNKNLQTVLQYSVSGEFVAEHSSAAAASKNTGINVSSIKAALDGRQVSAGQYLWQRKYNGKTLEEILQRYIMSSSCCEIEEIDNEGKVIASFRSCNEAEKFYGFGGNSIKPVCDGKRKHTRNKIFRWKNPLKRKYLGLE